jgi:hypothetical protein
MGKAKPPREIQERRMEGKKKRKAVEVPRSSLLTRMWNLFVAGTIVLGVLGTYFFFRPTIEIETPSSNPSDAYELFSRPFVIKNNSPWFSVRDVHASCGIVRVWRGTPSEPSADENNFVSDYVPPIAVFEAGEEHSVPCMDAAESQRPIRRAEVIVALDYNRPEFYLGHTETHQGYRAVIGADGKAYWTPYAVRQ